MIWWTTVAWGWMVDCTPPRPRASLAYHGQHLFSAEGKTVAGARRSLRLRAPDGALVPLEVVRNGRVARLQPREVVPAGRYTVEQRGAYDRHSQRVMKRGAYRPWFEVARVDLAAAQPAAEPTEVRFFRDARQLSVQAAVPEGSQLGLEVEGVGLVARGFPMHDPSVERPPGERTLEGRQRAFVADPGPCRGTRLPMRKAITVRAVTLQGDQAAAGRAYLLPPVRRPPPRLGDGAFRALATPRPVRVDRAPPHPTPHVCGTWGVVERQPVGFDEPVSFHLAEVAEDGLHVVLERSDGWVHSSPDGVMPLPIDGRVHGLNDGRVLWEDERGRWSSPVGDVTNATLVRASVTLDNHQIWVAATPVPELAGDVLEMGSYLDGQSVVFITRRPHAGRQTVNQVALDGALLHRMELPEAAVWSVHSSGFIVRFDAARKGTLERGGTFRWNEASGLVAAEPDPPRRSPPRQPGRTVRTVRPHPNGLEIVTYGCSEDGLGVPGTLDRSVH